MSPELKEEEIPMAVSYEFDRIIETIKNDWIKKKDAFDYILENFYEEVKEAVFEQEAEARQA